jgi:hypothetical protein
MCSLIFMFYFTNCVFVLFDHLARQFNVTISKSIHICLFISSSFQLSHVTIEKVMIWKGMWQLKRWWYEKANMNRFRNCYIELSSKRMTLKPKGIPFTLIPMYHYNWNKLLCLRTIIMKFWITSHSIGMVIGISTPRRPF